MNAFSDELRLASVVLLNSAVLAAAYRFARRWGTGGIVQAVCDTFLLYFLVQYLAVGLPGICGLLSAGTMSAVAVAISVGLTAASCKSFIARKTSSNVGRALPAIEPLGGQCPPYGFTRDTGVAPVREPPNVEESQHCESVRTQHGRDARVTNTPLDYRDGRQIGNTNRRLFVRLWKRLQRRLACPLDTTIDRLILLGCALFAAAYLVGHAWVLRPIPPLATDALVYHLPMAVQWLQTHHLGIYPTWYWNPAASYSPATGSMFMVWWMAPAGNDLFVRYVQLPALLFIFFLVVRMGRLMGCSRAVAGLIAVAATLSRPLFSETVVPKDDLYVTAFVAAAVLSLAREPIRERLGAWRVGLALGMVLASKYTVLLACPVFLLMIDSPFRARWRWRQWLIAFGAICALALPWYIRNIVQTGNPLYPVDVHLPGLTLRGLFGTERDRQLRSAAGVWHMLSSTYHSLPTPLIAALAAGWVFSLITAGRSVLRDPLPRACVLGSGITWILFLVASPHHEVRYLFPLMVLVFAAIGLGISRGLGNQGALRWVCFPSPGTPGEGQGEGLSLQRGDKCPSPQPSPGVPGEGVRDPSTIAVLRKSVLPITGAAIIAIISIATTFDSRLIDSIVGHAAFALSIAAIGVALVLLQTRLLHLRRDQIALAAGVTVLLLAMIAYAQWHAYVQGYQRDRLTAWSADFGYPHHAPLWKWVDENLPADASIAYANTFFVYPYYGFNFTRHVGYAPVREGLHDFAHLPRLGDRVPGDLIVRKMTEVMDAHPDRATWLENLTKLDTGYLIVMKPSPEDPDLDPNPPELRLAGEDPGKFHRIYEDEAGIIFRID